MTRECRNQIHDELKGIILCLAKLEEEAQQLNLGRLANLINDAEQYAAESAGKMEFPDLTSLVESIRTDRISVPKR